MAYVRHRSDDLQMHDRTPEVVSVPPVLLPRVEYTGESVGDPYLGSTTVYCRVKEDQGLTLKVFSIKRSKLKI